MSAIDRLDKFANGVNLVIETIVGINMIILTVVVFAQVFYRYVLRNPIPWSAEVARYFFIAIVFLGLSCAYRKGEHIGFTVLLNYVGAKLGAIILIFIDLSALFLMVVLLLYGYEGVQLASRQISPGIRIPMSIPYAIVPVGSALVILQIIPIVLKKCRHFFSLQRQSN